MAEEGEERKEESCEIDRSLSLHQAQTFATSFVEGKGSEEK